MAKKPRYSTTAGDSDHATWDTERPHDADGLVFVVAPWPGRRDIHVWPEIDMHRLLSELPEAPPDPELEEMLDRLDGLCPRGSGILADALELAARVQAQHLADPFAHAGGVAPVEPSLCPWCDDARRLRSNAWFVIWSAEQGEAAAEALPELLETGMRVQRLMLWAREGAVREGRRVEGNRKKGRETRAKRKAELKRKGHKIMAELIEKNPQISVTQAARRAAERLGGKISESTLRHSYPKKLAGA